MNILADTNVLIWVAEDNPRLAGDARSALADPANTVYMSVVSAWEIAIKSVLGKAGGPAAPREWVPQIVARANLVPLPVTLEHALMVADLPRYHNDPFDRLLIVQALAENLRVVTSDRRFEQYGIGVIRC